MTGILSFFSSCVGYVGYVGLAFSSEKPSLFMDEGGLRIEEPVTQYVPFTRIRFVEFAPASDRVLLIGTTADSRVIEAKMTSVGVSKNICEEIQTRSRAARMTMDRMATVRGDLGQWIATVSASHALESGGGHYRASFVDLELLERTLANTTEVIEARAASAHALLARGRSDVVAKLVGPSSPPFVIAATHLGKGGDKIVSSSVLESILPFLELRDRVVCGSHARARKSRVAA